MATARDLVTGFNIGRDMVANLRQSRDAGRKIDIARATLQMQQDLNNLSVKRFEDATGALGQYTTGIGELNPDSKDYYGTINRMKQELGPTIAKSEKVARQYQIFNQSLEESEKFRIGQHKVNSRMAAKATKIQNISDFEAFHGVVGNPEDPLFQRSVNEWVGGNKIVEIFKKYNADFTEEDREKIGKYATTHGGPSPEQLLIAENIAKRSGFMADASMRSDADTLDRQNRMGSMGMSLGSGAHGVPGSPAAESDIEFYNQEGAPAHLKVSSMNIDKQGFVSYSFGPKKDQEIKLTESQSKDLNFLARMEESSRTLESVDFDPTSFSAWVQGSIPDILNFARTEEFQVYSTAAKFFYNAQQRKDSGAAIPDFEMKAAAELWFPNPGDKPAAVALKRRQRIAAMKTMAANLPQEALNKARAGVREGLALTDASGGASPTQPQQASTSTQATSTPESVLDLVNAGKSPEGTYDMVIDGKSQRVLITKDEEFFSDSEKAFKKRYLDPAGDERKRQQELKAKFESIGTH
ncbi:MAG: hypothetical protein COA57_14750 [Flavobacteriales bacterium]|nr:MAG: hypothetical protein COA57_14750 [Flavobacteriales bacterium]